MINQEHVREMTHMAILETGRGEKNCISAPIAREITFHCN